MASRDEMLAAGYKYFCMECSTCYKEVPTKEHHTGYGRVLDIPCCPRDGCDLICHLSDNTLVKRDG